MKSEKKYNLDPGTFGNSGGAINLVDILKKNPKFVRKVSVLLHENFKRFRTLAYSNVSKGFREVLINYIWKDARQTIANQELPKILESHTLNVLATRAKYYKKF